MKKVVWVDDDPLLSAPLRQELELEDIELLFLESCGQYLKYIDSGKLADLFIVDLVMKPEGRISNLVSNHGLETGVPLTVETRKLYPTVPVLVFTNTANVSAREQAKKKLSKVLHVTFTPKSRMTQTGAFSELVDSLLNPVRPHDDSAKVTHQDWSFDVFMSYASEDRDSIAGPLCLELRERGWRVWFDQLELSVGDSLAASIDQGLSACRFGVVILSPAFLRKHWPKRELAGLIARETDGRRLILPIRHGVTQKEVSEWSPILAAMVAIDSFCLTIPEVVDELERVISLDDKKDSRTDFST